LDNESIEQLECFWEPDDGVFWKLRQGILDSAGLQEVAERLERVAVTEESQFPRRFVSLVWFIPIFFEWQEERVQERGGDMGEFATWRNRLVAAVQAVLGVP
jgi:hypothetical protein